MAVSRWRFRDFRINYFLLIVGITYGWIVLNSLYQITRIYNLSGNYWVIDTVTFVQAFSSAIFAHLPFVENIPGGPFFAVHSSPILYVLLPFYSISPGFSILYVIQSVILYSPAVVLYLIARKKMGNDLNAFLFASSYLLFGMVSTGTFEILSLFAGFFIYAYYFHTEGKIVPFFIFLLLALSTMEFAPIIGGMFGLLLIILELNRKNLKAIFRERDYQILRKYMLGVIVIAVSVIFFVVDLKVISFFSLGHHSALSNLYGTNVTSGSSLLQGLETSKSSKVYYLVSTNYSYLFLSFLDPIALLQIPWYLAIWISVFPYWTSYYTSYTWPFVVLGAIGGISRIGKLSVNKKMVTRILTLMVLSLMVVSWIAYPAFTVPSPVSQENLGVQQIADVIPENASVFSDIYSYPIISSHTWNTNAFGGERTFTVFNATDGPPYSLAGYGFYAASGDYLAYEKNYSSPPVINNFYYEITPSITSLAGAPFTYSTTLYLPKGNYEISANLVQKSSPGIETINPGTTTNTQFPVNQEVIQEFTVNRTISVDYIVISIAPTYGAYGIDAKITTSLDPVAVPIASYGYYGIVSGISYIQIQGPFTLYPGTSYYVWVGTGGYPGGIYLPLTHGTGLYEMSSTGFISQINNSLQFSIVGNIPGYKPKPTLVLFDYISGSQNVARGIYLTGKGYEFSANVTSSGNFSVLYFMTNYAYGSFKISPLIVEAKGATPPSSPYLENVGTTLLIALIPFYVLVAGSFISYGKAFRRNIRISGRIFRIIIAFIAAVFSLFFVVFSLGYYRVIPSLYSVSIFSIFGYILVASMLAYLALKYISRDKGKYE